MTLRTLILGSTAALAVVGAAQAADLPMTKAEAVEYMKVCTAFGAGFFYIPGSDTCLKISGEIRADNIFRGTKTNDVTRGTDGVVFQGRGKIAFDARTATDYGTLRSLFQVLGKIGGGGTQTFVVDYAYIQLGGLTAGFAHSFFGMYDAEYEAPIFAPYFTNQNHTAVLAYTANFGNGFTATLAAEDGKLTRSSNVLFADVVTAGKPGATGYGGLTAPDGVANLRIDQSWGKAELMAAVHQLRSVGGWTTSATPPADSAGVYDTKYGFAAGGSLGINLPVAAGGHIAVEGQYAKGALNYLGVGSAASFGTNTFAADWVQDDVTKAVKLAHGWSVAGEVGVNVTKALTLNAFGSYIDVSEPDLDALGPTGKADASFKTWMAGANAWYQLTKGFYVGAEVAYVDTNFKATTLEGGKPLNDIQSWISGVRVKRTF